MREIDVHYAATADLSPERAAFIRANWLTNAERTRADRFVFEKHRREYLATRALERTVLSAALRCRPTDLVFERNAYGKPQVKGADLRFNLTNAVDLVACVISRQGEVGIDTEPLSRGETVLDVAETVFVESERRDLASLEREARHRRAVELWTLKEAYMKGMGMGMSLPPDSFGFVARTLAQPPAADSNPTRWGFELVEVEGHLIAVCAETAGQEIVLRPVRASLSAET